MNPEEVRRAWAERTGEFSPAYYAHYGPDDASEAIRRQLEQYLDRDDAVLEVGCSSGRHLAHLNDHGFENLTGVEVNGDAFDVLAETYPELAAVGTFHRAAIEDVVGEFADDQFAAVYSVETLQHLHPDAWWVTGELARITGELLVTVENEGGPGSTSDDVNYVDGEFPLYYRDWNRVFTELGFREVASASLDRKTVRAFRPEGA